MFSTRSLQRIFRGARLTLPLVFWTFTAAPSFVDSGTTGSFQLAGYSDAQNRSGSLAGRLFESETYRPVIDTAVEDIYTALSKHDLDRALTLTDRLLEEFPNFFLGHMLKGDILSLKAGRPLKNIGDMPNVPRGKRDELAELREEAIARFKAVKDSLNATCCLQNWCRCTMTNAMSYW